ncbi:hypothetical protein [Variovorax sp. LjRoot84]|uniref:hypothetical protein n=1 Tax=Variovorax sp. LjRoot84 TaxID=3342340 RepID=UPI003F510741
MDDPSRRMSRRGAIGPSLSTTMHASTRWMALAAVAALASFGAAFAQAQEITDGSDYHPLMMNSPPSAEV